MYPNVTIIKRPGEINAWDNADFRAAVAATGKKQVLLGGITTDVRTVLCSVQRYGILTCRWILGVHHVRGSVYAGGRIHCLCQR